MTARLLLQKCTTHEAAQRVQTNHKSKSSTGNDDQAFSGQGHYISRRHRLFGLLGDLPTHRKNHGRSRIHDNQQSLHDRGLLPA